MCVWICLGCMTKFGSRAEAPSDSCDVSLGPVPKSFEVDGVDGRVVLDRIEREWWQRWKKRKNSCSREHHSVGSRCLVCDKLVLPV